MMFQTQGILLDEKLDGGREEVQLLWQESSLKVSHPTLSNLNQELNYSQIRFTLGGNRDSLLFLHHESLGSASIYVQMSAELQKNLNKNPWLSEKLAPELKTFRKQRHSAYLVLGILIALIVTAIAFRGEMAKGIVQLIPFETEKKIADLVYAKRKVKLEEKSSANEKLKELIEPIYRKNPKLRERLTVHITSEKEVNAYATIGGHLFVNRGLIEALKTPEQLLGVIAHEMVHVNERHVAQSVFQGMGLFFIVQALLGDVTGIVAVLADQGTPLLMLQHSRELESEADRLASEILMKSEIDARGLVEALGILNLEAKKIVKGTPLEDVEKVLSKVQLWSTHPEMEQRIRELETYIEKSKKKAPAYKPISFDYPAFVEAVRVQY